jgi:hypothetical protein
MGTVSETVSRDILGESEMGIEFDIDIVFEMGTVSEILSRGKFSSEFDTGIEFRMGTVSETVSGDILDEFEMGIEFSMDIVFETDTASEIVSRGISTVEFDIISDCKLSPKNPFKPSEKAYAFNSALRSSSVRRFIFVAILH